jgi:hypothetical protein
MDGNFSFHIVHRIITIVLAIDITPLPWWISYISNAIAELGQRLYSVSCKATSHAANHKQFENPSDDLNTFCSRWISCEEEAR